MRLVELLNATSRVDEGRDAPLYHWMNSLKAESVFKHDMMSADWRHNDPLTRKDIYGTSMSRNPGFKMGSRAIRLVFDEAKLSQTHKIIPIDAEYVFRHTQYNEPKEKLKRFRTRKIHAKTPSSQFAEEFIVDAIFDLHKYLKAIDLNPNAEPISPEFVNLVKSYARKYGIPLRTGLPKTVTEATVYHGSPHKFGEFNATKVIEAEHRMAEYGYWITDTGKVIPIMKQFDHEANAARFLGKTPQPAHPEQKWYYGRLAMEAGWVRVVAPNPESHYVLEFEKKRTTTLSRPQMLAVKSILVAHRKDPNLKEITIHDPYQKFWSYRDAMEFINDALTEARLTEGASPVLYHYTTVTNLEPILQNNEFSMATSYGTGAETPHDVKGAPYYLSTTRHKLGAYHSTGANYSVMLVLDGAALAQRYKIKPVDYWEAGPERSESEDRVFSREQTIPNASKYIKEIHIITEDPDRSSFSSDVVRRMTRKVLINAKKLGVPLYLYRDSKAWLLQDKRKALPISTALDQPEEKAGKRYSSMRTNWFKPWIELYHKNTAENLSSEAAKLLRDLRYDDYNGQVTRRLLNTVHNDKRSPNVVALIKLMQQNRLSTVAEYTALLKKKWGIDQ